MIEHVVTFTPEAWEQVQQMAAERNKTISELIRDSLALMRWFTETTSSGAKVLVERGGDIKQIVWED